MSATAILEFPELLAAMCVAVVLLARQTFGSKLKVPGLLRNAGLGLLSILPASYRQWLSQRQNWAGWRANTVVGDFAVLKMVSLIGALMSAFFIPLGFAVAAAVVAYFLPDIFLLLSVRERQTSIRNAIPQALDLMVLCVDAGLGLDATIQRVAADRSALNHALNDELAILGRDILLGMERSRAYTELYRRTGVEELKMVGSALNQSTKLGLSIAKILRTQADFMRTRQTQQAEERAAKLPVWMAFPLWFCIMPALMLIIIAPSLIKFLATSGALPNWFQ